MEWTKTKNTAKTRSEEQKKKEARAKAIQTQAQLLERYYHPPSGSRFEALRDMFAE